MNHLSASDAMFLHTETPEMPMHVGSLNVMDLPPGYDGDFYEDAKAHMRARLHLADVLTRKLALMPFDMSDPVWVEDEDIDLEHHVRHVTLPKPGTNRQLQQLVARLHSTLLDRSRPLWEFYVIDGLKSGQVALYTKAHHAGIDGQAGVALGRALFDLAPSGRSIRPPRPKARSNQYQLGIAELAGAAVRNTALQFVKLVKMTPDMARAVKNVVAARPSFDELAKRKWLKDFRLFAPRTPLNVAITNQRSFAGKTVPLLEVKMVAKRLGVSVNDVVMATVSGGLRRHLQQSHELPSKAMSAMVPVSLREAGDTTANNQVSMILVNLATDLAHPAERLKKINESSQSAKTMMSRIKAAIPTDFPIFGAPWLISGLATMVGRSRLTNVLPSFANVVISNVAGAPVPLYFAGAQVVSYYPVSIAAHGMALNVTVQSYNGRLDYGLIACRRAVPDINELGEHLLAEHRELLALAEAQPEPASAAETAQAAPARKRSSRATRVSEPADTMDAAVAKQAPTRGTRSAANAGVAQPARRRAVKPKLGLVA